jgi:hypothetical protein
MIMYLYFVLAFWLCPASIMLVLFFTHKRYARKCNYDCSKCRSWDCMSNYCSKHRKELENEEND